ncbi:peptidoglycan DD-metalloendopeptidase family protein [Kocuria sediminis]|uniref:Peptidoglycan DD-metalloendopeptidase family protein n=1 Tax=Kocuria sediminis TaxID=1038857 RepID=A0A6N8GNI7_9MICC|nr:M23 family metallopeptidase [Kocuria sediminis]MUN64329.1 peptidoglycan DD-metalloendopeptidase family protein [Kocuria sediminis]
MPRDTSRRPSTAGLRRRASSPVTALTAFSALVAVSVAVSSGIAPDAGTGRGSAFGTPSDVAEQAERTENRWSLMAAGPEQPGPARPLREARSVSPVRDGGAGEGSWREGAGRGEGGRHGVSTVRPGRQPPRLYQGELPVNTLIAPTSPGVVLPGGQFGWRIAPDRGGREFHNGTDVSAPAGLPVVAALDGEVTAVFWDVWGGNRVEVTHADGLKTTYNHLEDVRVRVGDRLAASEQLGAVGATGVRVTGPHLHFETWVDGQAVDPQSFDWVDGMRVIPASRSKYSLEVPVPDAAADERAAADRTAAAEKVAAEQKAATDRRAAEQKAAAKKAAEKKAAEQKTAQQKAAAEKRAAARKAAADKAAADKAAADKAAADKAAADKAAEPTKAPAQPPRPPAPEQTDEGPATALPAPPTPPTGTEQPPTTSAPSTPPVSPPVPGTEQKPAPTTPAPTPTTPEAGSPTTEPGVAPVVVDTVRDTDKDGTLDVDEDDIDGDKISNEADDDIDGDKVPNAVDPDLDGDGLRNEADPDMDGDGLVNKEDTEPRRPAARTAQAPAVEADEPPARGGNGGPGDATDLAAPVEDPAAGDPAAEVPVAEVPAP